VIDFVQDTCVIPSIPEDHANISSTLIAQLLYKKIVEGQTMRVRAIQKKMLRSITITRFFMRRLEGLSRGRWR
jgi:hypothetical protein